MRLGRALTACDLNPEYLDYWPSARRAWLEIIGVEPLLVLIADIEDVPADLRNDPYVVAFTPIPGVHTALQAQCIRLLYPALVDTEDAVLITDVDLYPLRRSYFVDPIRPLDDRFFVSYRDARLERGQVAIAYNAAVPSTWSELFGVSSLDDARALLAEWASGREYDGRRAWPGWYTDQEILYEALLQWPATRTRWWVMDDEFTKHRQLDRLELEHEGGLTPERRAGIVDSTYSDYICLFPYRKHREVNDLVLALGLQASRRLAGDSVYP
jgi:hypothetical protein